MVWAQSQFAKAAEATARGERVDFPDKERTRYEVAVRAWRRLKEQRGKRYENCTFDNYTVRHDGQGSVVERLKSYAKNAGAEIAAGRNIILFGPKGTGKDHLLIATAHQCVNWTGCTVLWVNGMDLYDEFQAEATGKPSKLFRIWMDDIQMETVEILCISDPLPPTGVLSEFQQRALFQLMDKRYSQMLPTFVTINVASGVEAESRMGAQVVDRLRHDALQCFCNWPSFRTQESKQS